jgi:O-antigen/teichoic acid export membrane protein
MTPTPRNATRRIASNTFWYGFESVFAIVMVFATSIPMARVLGPERLGYFQYVAWLTNVGTLLAIGIPSVTTKYMAEYLNRGETGISRAIFERTLSLQISAALVITTLGELIVFSAGDPAHRAVSMIQVLSMLPAMVIAIPSQANNAAEDMRSNVAGSIVSSSLYLVGVVASLYFHWDLLGVAIAFTLSRAAEVLVRLPPVWRRVRTYPKAQIPSELQPAMRSFALQSMGLMLLNVVVWDRSDVVLLKFLSRNVSQITYFTLTFNIVEKVVLLPQVFGHALGNTMLAEYGRDKSRVGQLASSAAKYLYLFAAPMLFGVALLSSPLMRVLYGQKYLPAIPVLAVAAGLALFKPLLLPVQYFLRSHSRQVPLLVWNSACGVLNVGVDWALIPGIGALGAGIGNGVAQAASVIGIWVYSIVRYGIRLDFGALAKITLALSAMAPPILLLNSWLPPLAALVAGVPAGAIVYLGLLRRLGLLQREDCDRLSHVAASVPKVFRPAFQRIIGFMVPAVPAPVGNR